jgi:hypothetical protein
MCEMTLHLYEADPVYELSSMKPGVIDACVTLAPAIGPGEDHRAYARRMVEVFRSVRRALKPTGVLWLGVEDRIRSAIGPVRHVVRLTDREIWTLRQIAEARNAPKMAAGVTNYRIDPNQSDFDLHFKGLKAEYAVAKALGVPFDLSISLGGDDHEKDLLLADGRTVSVKFRTQRGWDYALTRDRLSEFKADLGILVWPAEGDALELVGYVTREDFAIRARRKNFTYGDRLVVEAAQMRPIDELLGGPKLGEMMALPERVIVALQEDGWFLRWTGRTTPNASVALFSISDAYPFHPGVGWPETHEAALGVEHARAAIRMTTGPGACVLDPFAGRSQAIIAAAEEGREVIGVEADPFVAEAVRAYLRTSRPDLPSLSHPAYKTYA